MGLKGDNNKSFTLWEELKHLRVDKDGGFVSIYKRLQLQKHLPIEERSYHIHLPVPNTKGGIRKSLRTSEREEAIFKAEEMCLQVRTDLRGGVSVVPVSVEKVVEKFLSYKKSLQRGRWDSKKEKGRRSITKERYTLIAGKLRNYLVKFLGAKTDIRSVSINRFKNWEQWRKENNTRPELGDPKYITLQNEMGLIRECWSWGIEEGDIPFTPKLPFHKENLITDDKIKRDTWEPHEWNSFATSTRHWLNNFLDGDEKSQDDDYVWDGFVSYQMLFFLANSGMRVGELSKVKRSDVKFYRYEQGQGYMKNKLCCLVQVHPSNKTGGREVNAMGGDFAKRVYDKSKHKQGSDFLFCHLDGSEFTTKQFRTWFYRMRDYSNQNEKWNKVFQPYGIRHLYATTRLQNGTSTYTLCKNMGTSERFIREHYSKFLTRLASADLMKINKDIGLGGKFITDGEDFVLPEPEVS